MKKFKILPVFLLVFLWFLAGWPVVFINPRVPPEIKKAKAATQAKTFSFATTAEGFSGTSGGKSVLSYDFAVGSPAGSLKTDSTGRNNNDNSNWTWTGTWEDLGVPAGSVVTQVRLESGYTKITAWNTVDSVTIGPYKLKDSSGADQATLWTGRNPAGIDSDWVTISQQADQSVPLAIQSSGSTIKLYLERTLDLGNDKNAQATVYEDEMAFVITYAVVSISLTSDGSVDYGLVALNGEEDTTSTGLNDTQTITNDSTITENFNIKTSNATGGMTWTVGAAAGSDVYVHSFSTNGGSSWEVLDTVDVYETLATGVAASSSQDFDLKIHLPTETTDYQEKTITVTVQAVEG